MARAPLTAAELAEIKNAYEAATCPADSLAKKYGLTLGSLRTIAVREGWRRAERVCAPRAALPEDRLGDIETWWKRFDDVKDIARRMGLDPRTTKKLCEAAWGERDIGAHLQRRNETIVKLWNAGSSIEELASQFWLSPGSVKTLLSDARRAGSAVRKPEREPVHAASTDRSASSRSARPVGIGHNRPPRKPKAAELTPEQWEDALQRFERGEAVSSWAGIAGLPTVKQWHGHIERYAAFAARARNAMTRQRLEREASIDWDTAISRFEAGERLKDFENDPGMPDHNRWHKRITEDAAFRERALAARAGHNPTGGLAGRERWKSFYAFLAQGSQTASAARASGMTPSAVQVRRARWAEFRQEYDEIVASTREARRVQALFEYHTRFARRDSKARSLEEAISRLPAEVANVGSVHKAARALGIGKAALRYAMATNRRLAELEAVERQAKERKAAERKLVAERERQAKELRATPVGVSLKKSLSQNEVYRVLNAALPRAMDPDVRDDVLSSMMLAVLAGEVSLDEAKKDWKKFRTAYYRDFNWNSHVSLDEQLGNDGDGATRGDFIRSDTLHF